MTRGCIGRILELREMLLSFKTGFNLVNVAVLCAILGTISGLKPSSDTTEPRYLKRVTVSSFCLFTLSPIHSDSPDTPIPYFACYSVM